MVTLYLIKGSKAYDITDITQRIVWSGRKNSPARSLRATVIDDEYAGGRPNINVKDGQFLALKDGSNFVFQGMIESINKSSSGSLEVQAYDNAIFLSNNRDTFTYKKKTATQIFKDICKRYGIKYDKAVNTKYKIPVLAKDKTTIYDVMLEALSQTYKSKGVRYYIYSMNGKLNLVKRSENTEKIKLTTKDDSNITSYIYGNDISETKTRIKLTSKSGKVSNTQKDKALEKKIGQRQDIDSPDENLKKAKLKQMAKTMLAEAKKSVQSLQITSAGSSKVYSGKCVYVQLPEETIDRAFYVDADTHTWSAGGNHTMTLTLNFADDIMTPE